MNRRNLFSYLSALFLVKSIPQEPKIQIPSEQEVRDILYHSLTDPLPKKLTYHGLQGISPLDRYDRDVKGVKGFISRGKMNIPS